MAMIEGLSVAGVIPAASPSLRHGTRHGTGQVPPRMTA